MGLVRKTRLAALLATLTFGVVVVWPAPAFAGTATAADLLGGKTIGRDVQRALFGVNLTSSDSETWTSTTVSFTDVETPNFDMSDLQGDANDPNVNDGVAVYRDDGDVEDALDDGDTQVSTGFTTVGLEVTLNLSETVPASATGSYNYFITIATSLTIETGDDFTASLPSGCSAFDTGGLLCPVIGGTSFGGLTSGTITADATAPLAELTSSPTAVDDNVVWTFSEDVVGVDAGLDSENVVLRLDNSSSNLPASVTYNATAKTATINPIDDLTPGAAYDTIINPASASTLISDAAGNVVDLTQATIVVADLGFTPGSVSGNFWRFNNTFDSIPESDFVYGSSGDKKIVGDWNGDGRFSPGIVRGNVWYLNNNTDSKADIIFTYGSSTDKPIVGDWDGNGTWTAGVIRGNQWLLNNGYGANATQSFAYGSATDRQVVGDWNGDGEYTPGVVRGNVWHINNGLDAFADKSFAFGKATDKVVVGDWDGNGTSTPGVIRNFKWFLANDLVPTATIVFVFGDTGETFFAGDWDGSIQAASASPGLLPKILPGS